MSDCLLVPADLVRRGSGAVKRVVVAVVDLTNLDADLDSSLIHDALGHDVIAACLQQLLSRLPR